MPRAGTTTWLPKSGANPGSAVPSRRHLRVPPFFMSMDGRYSGVPGGSAPVMSMDGRYSGVPRLLCPVNSPFLATIIQLELGVSALPLQLRHKNILAQRRKGAERKLFEYPSGIVRYTAPSTVVGLRCAHADLRLISPCVPASLRESGFNDAFPCPLPLLTRMQFPANLPQIICHGLSLLTALIQLGMQSFEVDQGLLLLPCLIGRRPGQPQCLLMCGIDD